MSGAVETDRLARWRMAAYALPTLPLAAVAFPAFAILPAFYAAHTRIPLSVIGTILIASRVFDAVIDPAIGCLSDHTRSRWGARKPWLVAGALLSMVAVWRLYTPAPDVGPVYYAVWCLLFYLGFTLVEIPHKAWGTDIVRNYADRSAVSAWLGALFAVGNLAFAAVPFLPGFKGRGYDAETLGAVAVMMVAAFPICVGLSIGLAPQGRPLTAEHPTPSALLRAFTANRAFACLLAVFVLSGFGQGVFYSLVFLFVGAAQGLGSRFPVILLADALATFVAAPLWFRAAVRFEKHRAWAAGLLVSGLAVAAMAAVPAGPVGYPELLALIVVRAVFGAAGYVAPHAMLGDVVDYDIWRSRTNAAGHYNAVMALAAKANGAVGGGFGLVLIGWLGFAGHGHDAPGAISGFKVVCLGLPAVLLAAAAATAWAFPLDRRRHEIVRRRIMNRPEGARS